MKKTRLETEVIMREGKWRFDENVAQVFDGHIRRSVPLYDELHRMIRELAEPFLFDNAVVCDIGTSTGEAILNLNKRFSKFNLCYYGIDNSTSMLDKAREKCHAIHRVNYICADLQDFSFPESDLIISLYTLQFFPPHERRHIIQKVFNALHRHGAFIMAEKTVNEDDRLEKLFTDCHEEMKKRKGFSLEEIEAKKTGLIDVLHPISYEENIRLLKDCGFSAVETFFRWYNFMGVIAVKEDLP